MASRDRYKELSTIDELDAMVGGLVVENVENKEKRATKTRVIPRSQENVTVERQPQRGPADRGGGQLQTPNNEGSMQYSVSTYRRTDVVHQFFGPSREGPQRSTLNASAQDAANIQSWRSMNRPAPILPQFSFREGNFRGAADRDLSTDQAEYDTSTYHYSQTTTEVRRTEHHTQRASEASTGSQYSAEDFAKMRDDMAAQLAAKEKERLEKGRPASPLFKASRMALERDGLEDDKPAVRVPHHPYKGDMSSGSYLAQYSNLPFEENCAYWITNIPSEVTEVDLFAKIKTGAVRILHINPPTGEHATAAAKLVFMTPEGGHAFYKQLVNEPFLYMRGNKLEIHSNRNGYKRDENDSHSRVLLIEGPLLYMTEEFWGRYFDNYSVSKLEHARVIWKDDARCKMEFRFCRIDGQAETCYLAIRKVPFPPNVTVKYGRDPCDPAYRQTLAAASSGNSRGDLGGSQNRSGNWRDADWRGGERGENGGGNARQRESKPKFDPSKAKWRP